MSLGIVSPGYPRIPGGVTDHTARLVRHWTKGGREVRVLGTTTDNPDAIAAAWRCGGVDAILIQYVPFLYGRRGLSRFPQRLAMAARAAGSRTAVFVHEPWVPPTRMPWLVLSPLQRQQLRSLLRACDVAVTPVPAWCERLGGGTRVSYVGSTLGTPPRPEPTELELPAPVVFSPFASGLDWNWIVAAARSMDARPMLTVIGADWETARRHGTVKRWADPSWDWRGRLEAPQVLALLARAKLVLAPFVDGLTGRRTSVFAAASTGARLLSSRGPLFDPAFEAAPFGLADTKKEFCSLAQTHFWTPDTPGQREGRIAWYERHVSPVDLDRNLLALVLGESRPTHIGGASRESR